MMAAHPQIDLNRLEENEAKERKALKAEAMKNKRKEESIKQLGLKMRSVSFLRLWRGGGLPPSCGGQVPSCKNCK